ncbi:uridine kinase [Ordospora colligata]|uniref:Uridine kinase n=1 Tax=Ordospora colligata OC4 TaxID=1354746 RepID=A0A0B2UMB1_9MICR|nr:uridine kinase [Ordospora colligata OC4]KHN70409.1 uridine kinase [Ordospora colligata OC4]TBU17159.1 uridine kinase [Ordospora colligata]TBU17409.1 uridine kinase [Ordospora colligata]TBU19589.1 uridine kinase [Ordospora colligata]
MCIKGWLKDAGIDMVEEELNDVTECRRGVKDLRQVIYKYFDGCYDPSRRYIICIQGATSSGKSTFAKSIHRMLGENGINSHILALDAFYFDSISFNEEYDFDNPASLNWESVFEVLEAIRDEKPYIEHSVYYKVKYNPTVKYEKRPNPKPRVLIIEGIFAFNTINEKIFNIAEFDPYNSSKDIKEEFVDRKMDMGDFKILKVFMGHCASKILSVRLKRDLAIGRKKEKVLNKFFAMTFPSTLRWIYSSIYSGFIKIVHGNFNAKKSNAVLEELGQYFLKKKVAIPDAKEVNFFGEGEVECTGECITCGGIPEICLSDSEA